MDPLKIQSISSEEPSSNSAITIIDPEHKKLDKNNSYQDITHYLHVLKDQYSLNKKILHKTIQKDQLGVDSNLSYLSLSNNSDSISPSPQTQKKHGINIKQHQTSSTLSNTSNQPSSFSLQDSNDQNTVLKNITSHSSTLNPSYLEQLSHNKQSPSSSPIKYA